MRGPLPVARLKPRGFRLFGREVQEYVQTATMALFLHLLLGFTGRRGLLVETAHNLGLVGQLGQIKMTTHPQAAAYALDQAAEAADAELSERDDSS